MIDFGILTEKKPELRPAWIALKGWFERYPRSKYVDLTKLAGDLKNVPTLDLVRALDFMASEGLLRRVYRVSTPEGVLLEGTYAAPEDIPARLPNRFETGYFDLSEGGIVSGYALEASGAIR